MCRRESFGNVLPAERMRMGELYITPPRLPVRGDLTSNVRRCSLLHLIDEWGLGVIER
jgi:hypothetical protein